MKSVVSLFYFAITLKFRYKKHKEKKKSIVWLHYMKKLLDKLKIKYYIKQSKRFDYYPAKYDNALYITNKIKIK